MLNSNLTSTGQSTQLMTRRANLNTLKQLFKRQPATQNTSTQSIWLLPTELIISIIRYLDLCDTSALLQTCHKMQAITEDYLYANLAIPTVQGVPRTSELMRTLHARPDLSRRVASLEGYLYPLFAKEMAGISTQIPNSYFTFPSNLRSLYLYDHDWWYNPAFVQARYSLSHLALTSLTIRGSGLRGVRGPHHEPNIVPILRLQPILERLDLRLGKWDMESIGPCDIPDLATLSAGTDEARFIVPGRPITSLTLSVKRLEEEEVWKDISASTRRLTSLTLDVLRCGMLLPQTLEMAAAHMTGVESLTLQCLKAHYLEPVGAVATGSECLCLLTRPFWLARCTASSHYFQICGCSE
ncbi:hypothetical protein FRB98_002627 [Tulasnella sp. 332]|nr:hypothetical protein FRB98_002627 [Tulasnella sp. 332]